MLVGNKTQSCFPLFKSFHMRHIHFTLYIFFARKKHLPMNGIDILVDTTTQRRSQKTLKTSVVKGKQVGKKYNPYIKVVICNIWPKIMNSYRDQFGNLAIELYGSKVIKHFGILHKTCQVPRTWLLGL